MLQDYERFLISCISFAYPAYASFKALQTKEEDDDKQWLCFWILIGFVNVVDFFFDPILSWIPFYMEIKLSFIIWAQLPSVKGSLFLYQTFLEPQLKKYENDIDETARHLGTITRRNAVKAAGAVGRRLSEAKASLDAQARAEMHKRTQSRLQEVAEVESESDED
ncbi:TB2/DP1/HVA22-related protein [Carpediemonas membranifera]|uniref:TB2/DP1/HVA22-related protein n=1 Tax=Carpediemonas membranifera TaxID=201153 RepID=A0A8J6BX74_9EUKA|nr:TB2/DP1/HVA22-related protein [Carpediemonas membranifera]|eukprot:KAG9393171.1 TB2/DP1/HVA22-related protein [Carpediemonas membranifera]